MLGNIPVIKTSYISNRGHYNLEANYITIHGSHTKCTDADEERRWLDDDENQTFNNYHYIVDAKDIIATVPENEVAFHTGTFNGNKYSLGIEAIDSSDETLLNVIGLTALILYERQWSIDRVVSHQTWTGRNCPKHILPIWDDFIHNVLETVEYLKQIKYRR